jgi:hypothetical protein
MGRGKYSGLLFWNACSGMSQRSSRIRMHHEYCGVAKEDIVTGIVCDEEQVENTF